MAIEHRGAQLSARDNTGGWHRSCARRFFGRPEVPEVPEVAITRALLEELAQRSLQAGQAVTGVQKKLSVHLSDTEAPRRLTLVGVPAGYILKPPSSEYPELPELDLSDYFFLVVFSFVTGNSDVHLKNFSLYRPDYDWVLSPAYDLLATALVIPEDREEVALSLHGKKRRISRNDLVSLGESLGVNHKAVRRIIDAVSGHRETLMSTVEESFLSTQARTAYVSLIGERIGRRQAHSDYTRIDQIPTT